jgi:hypothetical protein
LQHFKKRALEGLKERLNFTILDFPRGVLGKKVLGKKFETDRIMKEIDKVILETEKGL